MPGTGAWPVAGVCWYEADAYARWAGGRLLEADEWEVAATHDPATGQPRLYPWGDDWADGRGVFAVAPDEAGYALAPVGTRDADRSALGCADMAGNVAEWTATPVDGRPGFRRICGAPAATPAPARDAQPRQRRFLGDAGRLRIPVVGFRVAWPLEGR